MRIAVLGAGLAGVTCAWRLAKDGHEVTVVDRGETAANFTSYANAGLVAPGHAYAWSSPKAPGMLLRSLWRDDQALRFRPNLDPALWRWTVKFLLQCTSERARINTTTKVRLCLYSQQCLQAVVAETGVAYDGRGGGLLYLYRRPASFEAAVAKMAILTGEGVELQALDPAAAAAIDPALAPVAGRLAGAVFAPGDESGDSRRFTIELAKACEARGVTFRWGETVQRLAVEGDRVARVATDRGGVEADAYVLALGVYSPHLARDLGLDLPIYPVKGYSVTIPTAGGSDVPRLGGVDEDNLVAYCPMGERLRVTATAEFAGYDTSHRPSDFRYMVKTARELFPEAGDYERPDYWACLRPMTPTNIPILGRSRHRNLFLNTGHGHMGWTMACGTAEIVADAIAGRRPGIDTAGMTLPGLDLH
ncbi:D-amino-acid dehydrogenase [Tistlia consotensis]|uniref:D-amino-acid dehydrogenase n=1 Tax=Tistlia consotensis USBA 355 TaxID=560819 RepID=A0A1Y6CL31_9PROT|nr:D-amino acid dehydrogenase [Tistlia consotensis]SMF60577.1 D-amino-acid dehydrogenase [Tistlia consotensis USBA 355]SNR93202.1 D-amino-acid dehydrogenase [Tistlia consotensis]